MKNVPQKLEVLTLRSFIHSIITVKLDLLWLVKITEILK